MYAPACTKIFSLVYRKQVDNESGDPISGLLLLLNYLQVYSFLVCGRFFIFTVSIEQGGHQ